MDPDIDKKKFDLMWERIMRYEQEEAYADSKPVSVKKIEKIIDEVYRQCY